MTLTPDRLRVTKAEADEAVAAVPPELADALRFAASRIEAFHQAQKPTDLRVTDPQGLTLGMRWTPLDSVGLYVPGGKAAYPSSVLMNAIPARVAGVARIAMCVPAPGGTLNPAVLAAARIAGVDEIYRIGGAQAVAALAFGTQSIPPVDRIVGPGNAYVAEAKRQVFGRVGIDSIAGPSEVVILAEPIVPPRIIALDLLAQAEHDEAAQSILIVRDAALARAVEQAVQSELARLPRAAIAGASWNTHGAIILVRDWDEAAALVNRLAPEHLQLVLTAPEPVFGKCAMRGRCSWAPTARKQWATTWPARTMCCRRDAPRASHRACRCSISSSAPPMPRPTAPLCNVSVPPLSCSPRPRVWMRTRVALRLGLTLMRPEHMLPLIYTTLKRADVQGRYDRVQRHGD